MIASGWAHRNVSGSGDPAWWGLSSFLSVLLRSCNHFSDLQQLENHMKSRKAREQEAREPVLAQLRGLVGTLQSTTEQMAGTVSTTVRADLQHELHVAVGRYVREG